MSIPTHIAYRALLVLACSLLAACGSKPLVPVQVDAAPVDFSGDWVVDLKQSDSLDEAVGQLFGELQRQVERQAQGLGTPTDARIYANARGLEDLVRMTYVVLEPVLLHIDQQESGITVKREGSFALQCDFGAGVSTRRDSPLGDEDCGWLREQLLFRVALPEGLRIAHRFTLDPAGNRLQVYTQLRSPQVSEPFGVRRVYVRYDPSQSGIICRQTLSKGKVCTTERPAQ
ncbi:hypothetical protein E4634_19270 [Mangrovimicrobium sediminis]|uniref:Lipoprotein n=1 Tax=Mangrovimicrobium sediminis TaxID=2562682 RepID=A0A4Z0LVR0_9GAMM|nr:hypothetical protein [Haliea sp. SAOS-164]TGD71412.1 hypothetical protein E4634_19270 [Haliea sp. SAOS-164]